MLLRPMQGETLSVTNALVVFSVVHPEKAILSEGEPETLVAAQ